MTSISRLDFMRWYVPVLLLTLVLLAGVVRSRSAPTGRMKFHHLPIRQRRVPDPRPQWQIPHSPERLDPSADPKRLAQEAYGRAEARFQAGDFEAAARECESALRLDPGCAEADALYLEVQFVLGHAAWPEMERHIACTGGHRQDQVFLEMREALQRGKALYDRREYDGAEREFRSVLEYVKWLPEDLDVLQLRREAAVWLECSRLDHP